MAYSPFPHIRYNEEPDFDQPNLYCMKCNQKNFREKLNMPEKNGKPYKPSSAIPATSRNISGGPMPTERFQFTGEGGHRLAAALELPDGEPSAYALFAHCFTCGKDVLVARRIAVALAEAALPASVGLKVHLSEQSLPPEFVLFGEDASRIVVSCDPVYLPRVREMAAEYEVHADVLGETGSERVEITMDGQSLISASIAELREAYEGSLERALRTESGVS